MLEPIANPKHIPILILIPIFLKTTDLRSFQDTSPDTFLLPNNYLLRSLHLNEQLLRLSGHIGYGIRPTERRKGYAAAMLKLALEKCRDMEIKQVLITCDKDNIASAKTIIANKEVLENELVEDNVNIVQRY